MSSIVEIKDLSFDYNSRKIFDNINLTLESGTYTTLVGTNGSGKSTLAKIILGMINSKSYVKVCGLFINQKNIKTIRQSTGYVFGNPNKIFMFDTVKKSMMFILKNYGITGELAEKKIEEVSKIFKIKGLLDLAPNKLSGGEKQIVALATELAHSPKLLIIDDGLCMIDSATKEKIYKILVNLNKHGMTIVNITNESDAMLYGTDIILLGNEKILLQEKLEHAFDNVKLFTSNKIELPFIIDLSKKLQYYKTIGKDYYDIKKLVDDLWK